MSPEAAAADPSVIASLTVPQTIAHLAETITELDAPPIIMGHSFGGTLTQLLLDRGCGAVGVAIDSAPTEGVHVSPPSQIRSLFPILKNPANRHKAVGFTPEEFHYAFANTLSEEESAKVYDRYHIPAPGNWVWAYGTGSSPWATAGSSSMRARRAGSKRRSAPPSASSRVRSRASRTSCS
jgi:pimeloyl-ACP methyl ester carboxylesterase